MRRLLFVDDEPSVLDGLRDLLRCRRHEWAMQFAEGAEAAIAALKAEPFDVVISDMRMPGMDGAELLEQVRQHWPGTVRFILTGHTEQEAAERAVTVAHQVLSKPCDPVVLAEAIERTLAVMGLLSQPALRDAMGGIETLPALPRNHLRLVELLRDETCSSDDVADLIERDTALAARILRLSNSGYFGLPRRLSRVADAVSFLGLRTIESVSLAMVAYAAPTGRHGIDLEALQGHAYRVGSLARRIVPDRHLADEAFLAGMLHDIGKMLLAVHLPDRVHALREDLVSRPRPMHEAEQEHFGVTHAEMGAYLLGLWNLPHTVVEAVALHHRVGPLEAATPLVLAVHAADVLVHECTGTAGLLLPGAQPPGLAVLADGSPLGEMITGWREIASDQQAGLEEAA